MLLIFWFKISCNCYIIRVDYKWNMRNERLIVLTLPDWEICTYISFQTMKIIPHLFPSSAPESENSWVNGEWVSKLLRKEEQGRKWHDSCQRHCPGLGGCSQTSGPGHLGSSALIGFVCNYGRRGKAEAGKGVTAETIRKGEGREVAARNTPNTARWRGLRPEEIVEMS